MKIILVPKSFIKLVLLSMLSIVCIFMITGCSSTKDVIISKEQQSTASKEQSTSVSSEELPKSLSQTKTTTISKETTTAQNTQPKFDRVNDAEKFIIDLLNSKDNSIETRAKIFNALASVDWKKYNQIHKDKDADLIDWLDKLEIKEQNEINSLIQGTKNLDGAYSEGYSHILTKSFIGNEAKFIKFLSNFQTEKINEICLRISGEISYFDESKKDSIKADLEKIKNLSTSTEKDIISKLSDILDKK